MSASTPNPPAPNAEAPAPAHEARAKEQRSVWTFWSLVLHGAAIIALVFVAYNRVSLEDKLREKKQKELSADRVEKLSEHIKQANLEELRKNLEDIRKSKAQIEELMPARNQVYAAFSKEMLARGDVNDSSALAAAVRYARQTEDALRLWQQRQQAFDDLAFGPRAEQQPKPGERNAILTGVQTARAANDELNIALAAAENALEKAFGTSSWTTPPQEVRQLEGMFQELGALREKLKTTGELFNKLQQAGLATPELVPAVTAMRRDLTQLQTLLNERIKITANSARDFAARSAEVQQAQAALAAAQQGADEAKKTAAETALHDAQRKQSLAQSLLERLQRSEELMRNRYEEQRRGCEEFEQLIEAAKAVRTEIVPQWRDLRQEIASIAQTYAHQRAALNQSLDNPERKNFRPQPGQAQPRPDPAEAADAKSLSLHGLYSTSDALEGLAVEEYRDLRAIELSQLREMPFDRARRNIDTPKPERTKLSADDLDGTPVNAAGLEQQKLAIRTALSESGRMREYCRSLVQMLKSEDAGADAALYQKFDPNNPDKEPDEDDLVTMQDVVAMLRDMLQGQVAPMQKLAGLTETARQTPAAASETTPADMNTDEAVELLAQAIDSLDDDVRRPEDLDKAAATLKIAAAKLQQTAEQERVAEEKSGQAVRPLPEQTARNAAEEAERMQKMMEGMSAATNSFSQMKMVSANSPAALRKKMLKARAMAAAAAGTLSDSVDLSELMKADPSQFGKSGEDGSEGTSTSGSNTGGNSNSGNGMNPNGTLDGTGRSRDGRNGQGGDRKSGDGATVWERLKLKTNVPHPAITVDSKGIIGGRMLAADGPISSSWMAVDSWYVVGPWPNPGRVNMDKKYPPENAIDLDASYAGKDGRILRWQFMQAPSVMLQPTDPTDYAIYYLYTEIRSDRDRDIWLVTGSDDKSKIWINDMLIWESRPELKPWRIGEGFRKVHLRKGVNRVLYRLENGWYAVAMSLLFCTGQNFEVPVK